VSVGLQKGLRSATGSARIGYGCRLAPTSGTRAGYRMEVAAGPASPNKTPDRRAKTAPGAAVPRRKAEQAANKTPARLPTRGPKQRRLAPTSGTRDRLPRRRPEPRLAPTDANPSHDYRAAKRESASAQQGPASACPLSPVWPVGSTGHTGERGSGGLVPSSLGGQPAGEAKAITPRHKLEQKPNPKESAEAGRRWRIAEQEP
jgi:hypothetical protein